MARTKKDKVEEIKFSTKLKDPISTDNGEKVYLMPIIINNRADLDNFGIDWKDCKTLNFGTSKGDTVYFYRTTDKALADFHWAEINTQHSRDYRSKRCKIPGTLKPLITCPDTNKCSQCPYPEYRDKHKPDDLSLERLEEDGYEIQGDNYEEQKVRNLMILEDVCREISHKNPKFAIAIVLKEYFNLSVKKIAEALNDSERNVYFYLSQARKIGKAYKA